MKRTDSDVITDNSKKRSAHRKAPYVICFLGMIILLAVILVNLLTRTEDIDNNGIARFYSSNDGIYVFGGAVDGVCEINASSRTYDKITQEAANSLYVDEDHIIYDNGREIIAINRNTNSKKALFSFEGNTPERVKSHKNVELLDTPPIRWVGNIAKSGKRVFFTYCVRYELMPDEHTNVGEEMWNYIYSANLETGETEIVKSSYYITPETEPEKAKNYTFISDMILKDDFIYYRDLTAVYRADVESGSETELYRFSKPIICLFWTDDGFDVFIYNDTGDIECVRIDNSGDEVFRCPIRTVSEDFFPQSVFYDATKDRYLYMSGSELKAVSFANGSKDETISEMITEIETAREGYQLVLSDIYSDGETAYLLFEKLRDYKPCGFTVLSVKDSKDISTIMDIKY